MVRFTLLGALLCAGLASAQPVKLRPYPQKFRTFYTPGDSAVPAGLKADPAPLPFPGIAAVATASDGAVWIGTGRGLIR